MGQGSIERLARMSAAIVATGIVALALAPFANAKGTAFIAGGLEVDAETIGADGGLTPIPPAAPTGAIGAARGVAVTPDAKHVYVAGAGGAVAALNVSASGSLSAVAGSPFATGGANFTRGIAITPDGKYLYASDENGGAGAISIFSVNADGTLTQVGANVSVSNSPEGLAVSPNGQFLFVAASPTDKVSTYAISATGTISAVGTPAATGTAPNGIAVTPSGAFLYVSNSGTNSVSAFAVAADGTLTSLGTPTPTGGNGPETLAVTPDGRFVYTADFGTDKVSALAIATDGTLSAVPGQPFTSVIAPYGVDAAPNGAVYSASFDAVNPSKVNGYTVQADGSLVNIPNSPFTSQVKSAEFQSVAATPNQGPSAALTATPAASGQPTTFDAAGSADTDGGTVARYDWVFGDGQTLPNGGPSPSHVYAQPGPYVAAVTVTDNEGCSTTVIFTGQTADCNGSAAARAETSVQVPPGAVVLKLSGKRTQPLDAAIEVGARCSVACTATASGRLIVTTPRGKRATSAAVASRRTFKIKKVSKDLQAGKRATLRLRLSKRARKAATKALARHGSVIAKIKVTATSASGVSTTARRKVKLVKRR